MRKFLFLALAACMLQISASAFSDGAGLTLDAGVSGVTVKVYDVGSARDGAYVLDDAFSRYGTDLNVDGAADELAGSFRKDGMACLRYGVTDEYGRVEFGGLGPGVYLASCDGFESGGAAFGSYAVLLESDGAADMTVVPEFARLSDAPPAGPFRSGLEVVYQPVSPVMAAIAMDYYVAAAGCAAVILTALVFRRRTW